MKIVILGASQTGSYVASALSQQEHDVTLIDRDPKALEQMGREADVATVLATMPDLTALSNIAEQNPDLFFAATGNDETNLISCSLAKNLGVGKTAARIKSRSLLESEALDIGRLFYVDHFIGAEILSAHDLFKLLMHAGDTAFEHFAHGAVLLRTIVIPPQWKRAETPIKDLRLPQGLIAGLIRRDQQVVLPHGSDHILPGDEVSLIGESNIMHELHELFHIPEKKIKGVILIGGSETAFNLAKLLLDQKIAVRILEANPDRCRELSDSLPNATILNRDVKIPASLTEENLETTDAVVCCTEDDGLNFLVASMAVHLGAPRVLSLLGDPIYIPLFEQGKIIPAISARIKAANRLLSILHARSILSVGSISNNAAKIVELKVSPSSSLIGVPLADLKLPKDFLIAVIETHGNVMIGRGSSVLCPDDTVIAICSQHCLEHNYQIFE